MNVLTPNAPGARNRTIGRPAMKIQFDEITVQQYTSSNVFLHYQAFNIGV